MALRISPDKKRRLRAAGIGGASSARVTVSRPTPKLEAITDPRTIRAQRERASKAAQAARRVGLTPAQYEQIKPDYYRGKLRVAGFTGAGLAKPIAIGLEPLTTLAQVSVDAPAGAVLSGKIVGKDFARARHGDLSFKGSRTLGKAMAHQIVSDFTHPSWKNAAMPVLDLAGLASFGAGTAARGAASFGRVAAATKAARAAELSRAGRTAAVARIPAEAVRGLARGPHGDSFPRRTLVYQGQPVPGTYSRSALSRTGQRFWDRALGLSGHEPLPGFRGPLAQERLAAGKVGKAMDARQRVLDRTWIAPAVALAKAGRKATTPQEEALRIAAEGVPAAERAAYHGARAGGLHAKRAVLAGAAQRYLADRPTPPSYPPGTLFHGSPEGLLGNIDTLHHTKAWGEGIGFYVTENYNKAVSYARGRTATGERKVGAASNGVVNPVSLHPGAKVLDLEGPVDLGLWRQIGEHAGFTKDEFDHYVLRQAGSNPTNKSIREELLIQLRDMHGSEAPYTLEDAYAASGIQATSHIEGIKSGNPHRVYVVKDPAIIARHDVRAGTLAPEINPAADSARTLRERLTRHGVGPEQLAALYSKSEASAGRREQVLQRLGLSNPEQFAGRVQGPGRVYQGASFDPELGQLVGAEGFSQGKFRVPATPPRRISLTRLRNAGLRKPAKPGSLTKPFTGRMVETGTHGGKTTQLVARSEIEASGLANLTRRIDELVKMGVKAPPAGREHAYRPVVTNPRISAGPLDRRALARAEQGLRLTGAERKALGKRVDALRAEAFPETVKGQRDVVWVPKKLLRGLDKPEGGASLGARAMDELNRAATAGVLYAGGTGYAIPQLLGNEAVRFADQGLLGPVRGVQAARMWKRLDTEGRAFLTAMSGSGHGGIIGSVTTPEHGPVSHTVNRVAHLYSLVIDSPLRTPSIVHAMAQYGYKATPEDFARLLGNEDDMVRVATTGNENSIDYSRLGVNERRFARRLAWFYPWLKASSVYAARLPRERPALSAGIAQAGAYGTQNTGLVDQPAATEGTFKIADSGNPNQPWTSNPQSAAILGSWAQMYQTAKGAAVGGLRRGETPIEWATPGVSLLSLLATRSDPFIGGQIDPKASVFDVLGKAMPTPKPVTLMKQIGSGGSVQFPMSKRDALKRFFLGSEWPRREDQAVTAGYKRKDDRALMTPGQRLDDDHHARVGNAVRDLRASGIIQGYELPPELKQALGWQNDQNQYRLRYSEQHGIKRMRAMDNLTADLEALLKVGEMSKADHDAILKLALFAAANPGAAQSLTQIQTDINALHYGRGVISLYRHGVLAHNRKPGF